MLGKGPLLFLQVKNEAYFSGYFFSWLSHVIYKPIQKEHTNSAYFFLKHKKRKVSQKISPRKENQTTMLIMHIVSYHSEKF